MPLEQLLTEREEGLVREAVILEDDCFLYDRECPIKPTNDSLAASKVARRKVRQYVAWPVNGGHDLSDFLTELLFTGSIGPRAVCDEEESCRTDSCNPIENKPRGVRPIKDDEQYRNREQVGLTGFRH
jgi:hypothetical protein